MGMLKLVAKLLDLRKMALSPETSSKRWDVGTAALSPLMFKISVSPETSSQNGDVEIIGETVGSSKMSLSPETSSKN